mmetsp:Transcript_99671/g.281349  ORF Transcript_99671/g.281349 Transcript_99671/m.281349 type:complete len:400 (+) Transcript_99671:209-1408(+)
MVAPQARMRGKRHLGPLVQGEIGRIFERLAEQVVHLFGHDISNASARPVARTCLTPKATCMESHDSVPRTEEPLLHTELPPQRCDQGPMSAVGSEHHLLRCRHPGAISPCELHELQRGVQSQRRSARHAFEAVLGESFLVMLRPWSLQPLQDVSKPRDFADPAAVGTTAGVCPSKNAVNQRYELAGQAITLAEAIWKWQRMLVEHGDGIGFGDHQVLLRRELQEGQGVGRQPVLRQASVDDVHSTKRPRGEGQELTQVPRQRREQVSKATGRNEPREASAHGELGIRMDAGVTREARKSRAPVLGGTTHLAHEGLSVIGNEVRQLLVVPKESPSEARQPLIAHRARRCEQQLPGVQSIAEGTWVPSCKPHEAHQAVNLAVPQPPVQQIDRRQIQPRCPV